MKAPQKKVESTVLFSLERTRWDKKKRVVQKKKVGRGGKGGKGISVGGVLGGLPRGRGGWKGQLWEEFAEITTLEGKRSRKGERRGQRNISRKERERPGGGGFSLMAPNARQKGHPLQWGKMRGGGVQDPNHGG